MEWMERLNEAIAYMEEHMQEEISFEEVAKLRVHPPIIFSGCSLT